MSVPFILTLRLKKNMYFDCFAGMSCLKQYTFYVLFILIRFWRWVLRGLQMSVYLLTLRTGKSQESHEITHLSWWNCPFLCYTTGEYIVRRCEDAGLHGHISYHHLTHKPSICLYKFKLSLQMPTRIEIDISGNASVKYLYRDPVS